MEIFNHEEIEKILVFIKEQTIIEDVIIAPLRLGLIRNVIDVVLGEAPPERSHAPDGGKDHPAKKTFEMFEKMANHLSNNSRR